MTFFSIFFSISTISLGQQIPNHVEEDGIVEGDYYEEDDEAVSESYHENSNFKWFSKITFSHLSHFSIVGRGGGR